MSLLLRREEPQSRCHSLGRARDDRTVAIPFARALDRLQVDPWQKASPFDLTKAIAAVDRLIEEQEVELPEFDRFGRT